MGEASARRNLELSSVVVTQVSAGLSVRNKVISAPQILVKVVLIVLPPMPRNSPAPVHLGKRNIKNQLIESHIIILCYEVISKIFGQCYTRMSFILPYMCGYFTTSVFFH